MQSPALVAKEPALERSEGLLTDCGLADRKMDTTDRMNACLRASHRQAQPVPKIGAESINVAKC